MSNPNFKWKHFAPDIILWCLRWYGSTTLSYANLSDMLAERGVFVNRSSIYRWFIEYAPALRKKLKAYQFKRHCTSWQLDETYVKVKGKWHYLYRAINKYGETIDFHLSHKRDRQAAYEFLKRCLKPYCMEHQPDTLNTDKHSSYAHAIARLKREGKLRTDVAHRQIKYLNNEIESDHAPIKKLIKACGHFKIRKRAWSTLQGFECLRMLCKGQFDFWLRREDEKLRQRERSAFINRLFDVETIFA